MFNRKQGQSDDEWTWCVVEHSNQVFRAQIQHVGRGKFKIVNDNQEKTHVEKLLTHQKFSTVINKSDFELFDLLLSSKTYT